MKRIHLILVAVALTAVPLATLLARGVVDIPWQVAGGGGGQLVTTRIGLRSTVGQPVVADATEHNIRVMSGYWEPVAGVSASPQPEIPERPLLYGNTPNPFNPRTTIRFNAGRKAGPAQLAVFDVQGRLVRTLLDGTAGPGMVTCTWQGHTDAGREAASGVYFCRLRIAGEVFTRKMLLVR